MLAGHGAACSITGCLGDPANWPGPPVCNFPFRNSSKAIFFVSSGEEIDNVVSTARHRLMKDSSTGKIRYLEAYMRIATLNLGAEWPPQSFCKSLSFPREHVPAVVPRSAKQLGLIPCLSAAQSPVRIHLHLHEGWFISSSVRDRVVTRGAGLRCLTLGLQCDGNQGTEV